MKLFTLTSLTVLASSILPSFTSALAGFSWQLPSIPSGTVNDLTFSFNLAKTPHRSGYFFTQQFEFQGQVDVGEIGLQPQPDASNGQSTYRVIFSSFIMGTTTNHPNCQVGAEGGHGISCSVNVEAVDYTSTVDLKVENIGGTTWRGTVNGGKMVVGEWTLPSGTGGLKSNGQSGTINFIPFSNGINTCTSLPFTNFVVFPPTTTSSATSKDSPIVGEILTPVEFGICDGKVAFSAAPVANGGFDIKIGF